MVDTNAQRIWQGFSAGQSGVDCSQTASMMPWMKALSYCEGLSWDGFEDWRPPNIKELRSIVDERTEYPAFDATFDQHD